jgi:hypothetical protein
MGKSKGLLILAKPLSATADEPAIARRPKTLLSW